MEQHAIVFGRRDPILNHTALKERVEASFSTFFDGIGSVHAANVLAGWWDDSADENTQILRKCNLVACEAAEAVEAMRKGLMDDKLPQYPGELVEFADVIIRCQDLIGRILRSDSKYIEHAQESAKEVHDSALEALWVMDGSLVPTEDICANGIMNFGSGAGATHVHNKQAAIDLLLNTISLAVIAGEKICHEIKEMGLWPNIFAPCIVTVVLDKMEFNANRADHKLEARRAAGGKSY